MDEEILENQDSTNTETPVIEQETTEAVDVNAVLELNKQLYERTKKAEADAKEAKAKLAAVTPASEPNQPNTSSTDEDWRQRIELKTDGYKGEEIDFIMRNGGKTALEDPLVKAAINSIRKAATSQNATPSGTNKSPVYQKFTERDLKNMPLADLEKIIPQE